MGAFLFVSLIAMSAAVAAALGVFFGFAIGWGWRGAIDQGRIHIQNRAFQAILRRMGIRVEAE